MRINGRPVNVRELGVENVIKLLQELPTGFKARNLDYYNTTYSAAVLDNSQGEGLQLNHRGIQAYKRWESNKVAAVIWEPVSELETAPVSEATPDELKAETDSASEATPVLKPMPELEEALALFQRAAEASLRENKPAIRAWALSNFGQVCRLIGRSEQGLSALEEAMMISAEQMDSRNFLRDLVNLHANWLDVTPLETNYSSTEEAAHSRETLRTWINLTDRVISPFVTNQMHHITQSEIGLWSKSPISTKQRHASLRYLRQRALLRNNRLGYENINYAAYNVARGEIGFSSTTPIGTCNPEFGSVYVVLRDTITKKTAIAHICQSITNTSLQLMLDRMPLGHPLEARLIGWCIPNSIAHTALNTPGFKETIEKIVSFFNDCNINVLSAAILHEEIPSSIVVYPETFEIVEEIPGLRHPHMTHTFYRLLSALEPLQVVCDLTSSMKFPPIILQDEQIMTIQCRFVGKSDDELYDYFFKLYKNIIFDDPSDCEDSSLRIMRRVEHSIIMREEHKKSADYVISKLNQRIADLEKQGAAISDLDRAEAVKIISQRSIHVGYGADQANQPLVNFIEGSLFSVKRRYERSGSLMEIMSVGSQIMHQKTDLAGLRNFRFPDQQYQGIEESINPPSFQERLAKRHENPRKRKEPNSIDNARGL